MDKLITTLNIPAPTKIEGARQAQWIEARSVFSIYIALAKQLDIAIPFPHAKRILPEKPELELFSQVHSWLDSMDQRVLVHQLRHLLQMTTLNASESGLQALIQRHLRKASKTNTDRDKVDFLLVQYFALCAPAKIYHKQIDLIEVAEVMRPIFGEVDTTPLPWCEPLDKMIEALRGFRSLREILKTNFIDQGRKVKETAGIMFYEPSSLLAFIRFNFLLRRTLIELMHADLIAVRNGLEHLEEAGVRIIDCHHFGMSAAEPVGKIRKLADEWKQPFQQEYTERTVSGAFEKLLGLRSDVDQALEKIKAKAGLDSGATLGKTLKTAVETRGAASGTVAEEAANRNQTEAGSDDGTAFLDFDTCLEKIWEQLIATPPTRGRSMTTVKIEGARILMSSWEVAAFVSETGASAEDLRRAVVARALMTAAIEQAKTSGNSNGLDHALQVARVEVARLQERVDVAKQAKDTEAAVNLGISTKRLLSALDEAEKL